MSGFGSLRVGDPIQVAGRPYVAAALLGQGRTADVFLLRAPDDTELVAKVRCERQGMAGRGLDAVQFMAEADVLDALAAAGARRPPPSLPRRG